MPQSEPRTTPLTLDALNRMERAEFTRVLGAVFENSPWVAERAWERRPFASLPALHAAMVQAVRQASREDQLDLLRAHPDLAGKAARAGAMSIHSVGEQASAGLDRLSEEEHERFGRLNSAYRARFAFPFIIAVRRYDKAGILRAFEERLGHTETEEVDAALAQVFDITRMRLEALVAAP